jgi:hypothetical protein
MADQSDEYDALDFVAERVPKSVTRHRLVAEKDYTDPDIDKGLYGKFRVERITPSTRGIDHSDCRYFVLDPQHDVAALAALARYAQVVRAEGFGPLADDLDAWVQEVMAEQDTRPDTSEN